MVTLFTAFFIAAIVALATTPIIRQIALKKGAVSVPGGRNVNAHVIPRLGGVSIAFAAIIPLAVLFVVDSRIASVIQREGLLVAGLGLGAVLMCGVGARDDLQGLRAATKLAAQVLCAVIAYYAGFQIHKIYLPFIGVLDMGVFALPVTVAWIVGITNAVNLIDGLDGLAAGVVFCAAGTNLVVALITGNSFVAVTMASLMGALIGFLFYNFNPAKIFMGDSGSYFLGFALATVSLAGSQKASTAISLLVPVLALGLPIFDTLFSIIRRTLQRRSIFSADRGHLHHRLLDMGLTHRRAVLTLYLLSLLFALAGVGVSLERDWQSGAAILGAMVLVVGLVGFIRMFDRVHAQRRRHDDDLAAKLLQRLPAFVRSWKDTDQLEFANRQLADLRADLPNLNELKFVSADEAPARQAGTVTVKGAGGKWALLVRSSSTISFEARALMRMIVQTADLAAQEAMTEQRAAPIASALRPSGSMPIVARPLRKARRNY